ncbi:MAG: magnesium transporter CorA family protein [Chloroflexota bacterium]
MTMTDASGQKLKIELVEHEGLAWYDLRNPGTAEMAYIQEHFPFHPLDLEDSTSRLQLPKLDEYPAYLFLVLHFPVFNERTRLTRASQIAIFVGASYVVTIHRGELRPLVKLLQDCSVSEEVRKENMGFGSGFLLYQILSRLVDYSFPILNKVMGQVDGLESVLFEGASDTILRDLAFMRRDILAYRRIVRPQIPVLEALESNKYPFLHLNMDVYFGDLADQVRRIWVELEDLKEVAQGLQDTHAQLTNQHTNEVIRVLTVFASVMLPLTVVTSFYGMNVPLPFEQTGWTALAILAFMAAMSAGLMAFLVRRKWL